MVRVVTGLSLDKLLDAPVFSEIEKDISRYFDDKTVIIGHNVQFDISILQQYLQPRYFTSIDTFPHAQAMMPFSPSYALEVLEKSIIKSSQTP